MSLGISTYFHSLITFLKLFLLKKLNKSAEPLVCLAFFFFFFDLAFASVSFVVWVSVSVLLVMVLVVFSLVVYLIFPQAPFREPALERVMEPVRVGKTLCLPILGVLAQIESA